MNCEPNTRTSLFFTLTAKEKIAEAQYFLDRLPSLPLDKLRFEVSAFLAATRSIFDHLLEEYRQKFLLGDIKRLSPETFEKNAERTSNEQALKFIKWYQTQMDSIRKDHEFLFDIRNLTIHSKTPRETITIEMRGPITVPAGTTTEIPFAFPPLGRPTKVEGTIRKTGSEMTEKVQAEIHTTAFFEEMPDKDLLTLCDEFLTRAKELVQQAESLWGKT